MVQLFYYETRGKNYRKLVKFEGAPFRVNLHPNEELGSTLTSHWIIKIPWWRKTVARIVEVCGGQYRCTSAKVTDLGNGNVVLKGCFKKPEEKGKIMNMLRSSMSTTKDEKLASEQKQSLSMSASFMRRALQQQDDNQTAFQLHLSTDVTNDDFQRGYSMTGKLEQSRQKDGPMTLTHFAVVKRKGY